MSNIPEVEKDDPFPGDNPLDLARTWLVEAEAKEINDPNAMALATVDENGLPNVRMVLLKEISDAAFLFYTNYESVKSREIEASQKAAFVLHWKSMRRQIRVRGLTRRVDAARSDAYFNSRSLQSRLGAIASKQSRPLGSRAQLVAEVAKVSAACGMVPKRPAYWGGYEIVPIEIEFWSDGAFRLHDRVRWRRDETTKHWEKTRLYP